MNEFADADEQEAAGDPPIDWGSVEKVADIFTNAASPLEALTAIYGDKLDVPS